ncbi:hypothetical protein C1H46_008626 [Malus baccata]|uniref:Uncharacterized protein n=1 Tax=Malus baccata TaxID=106549 RepID=A0A540N5E5_MALBA|nr:hypothetical protein C1H46_008626 [Malus baccata]
MRRPSSSPSPPSPIPGPIASPTSASGAPLPSLVPLRFSIAYQSTPPARSPSLWSSSPMIAPIFRTLSREGSIP